MVLCTPPTISPALAGPLEPDRHYSTHVPCLLCMAADTADCQRHPEFEHPERSPRGHRMRRRTRCQ